MQFQLQSQLSNVQQLLNKFLAKVKATTCIHCLCQHATTVAPNVKFLVVKKLSLPYNKILQYPLKILFVKQFVP